MTARALPAAEDGRTAAPDPVREPQSPRPAAPRARLGLAQVLLDVLVGVAHALNLLGVFVRYLDAELLLEAHDEFDGVQRVGP